MHHTSRSGTAHRARSPHDAGSKNENFGSPTKNSIPTMIRSYKSAVTKQIREQAENPDLKVWQKGYYEHVIRNEESYLKISEYIKYNYLKWKEDKYFT